MTYRLGHATHARAAARQRQRGVSLFVVVIIVLLSMLLALWASRSAWFGEMVVGNDADYQRATEAVEALLQDAELDIRRAQSDGSNCVNATGTGDVCRATTAVWFPVEEINVGPLFDRLNSEATRCLKGICQKRVGVQDWWNDAATLTAMTQDDVGARYGQFSGAAVGTTTDLKSNPILKERAAGLGGWYWVEVLPYDSASGTGSLVVGTSSSVIGMHMIPSVAYRITAIARGMKEGTLVAIQQTYVRQKLKN